MADDKQRTTGDGSPATDNEPTFTPISELGEFGLIDGMRAILGEPQDEQVLVGISDDAAVYRIGGGRVHVITTDALIEGVHFDRSFTPLDLLGFKALSVNVSDVVAMNAIPRYATLAVGLPATFSVEMVAALYRGLKRAADLYGMTIVGGDTTAARSLILSVTVVGEAAEEEVVYRRGAHPGDALCVTGDLGGAYAGLRVLLDRKQQAQQQGEGYRPDFEHYSYVIQRQLAPTARLNIIQDWKERGVRPHALIDISDGLASETHHICKQSGCGALIYTHTMPIDLVTRDVADEFEEDVDTYALFGGEDYELLFALDPADLEKLDPESFVVIGEFTDAAQGVQARTPEGQIIPLQMGGFQHFGGGRG